MKVVKDLLSKCGLNAVPGSVLTRSSGAGEYFLKFALVSPLEKTREAAEGLKKKKIFK